MSLCVYSNVLAAIALMTVFSVPNRSIAYLCEDDEVFRSLTAMLAINITYKKLWTTQSCRDTNTMVNHSRNET